MARAADHYHRSIPVPHTLQSPSVGRGTRAIQSPRLPPLPIDRPRRKSKRSDTVYGGAYRLDGDLVRILVRMRRGLWARWQLRILGRDNLHMTTPFALSNCDRYRDSDGTFRLPPNTRLEVMSLHILSPPKELDPVQRPELLAVETEEEGEMQLQEPKLGDAPPGELAAASEAQGPTSSAAADAA